MPDGAPHEHVHRRLGAVRSLGGGPQEPQVRHLDLPACVGAPRPVHPHHLRDVERPLEVRGHVLGALLRLDLREPAEPAPRARHHVRLQLPGGGRELGQQRLRQQVRQLGVRHPRQDHVLLHRHADVAVAVGLGEVCECEHVVCLEPSHGHVQPHEVVPVHLLVRAEVPPPRPVGVHQRGPLLPQRPRALPLHARRQLGAEGVDAQLLDEVHDARLLTVLARAEVAEGGEHGVAEGHELLLRHPRPQRDGPLALHRAEEPSHLDVEADLAVLLRGDEGEVVDVGVLVQVVRPDHRDVELAGQVGDLLVAAALVGEELVDDLGVGARVQNLLRVDSRQRAPHHVAHVVHPALGGGHAEALQVLEDARHVRQLDAAELNVLPRGDVRAPVLPVALHELPEVTHLLGGDDAVVHAQPHHELTVGGLRAMEQADELQARVHLRLVLLVHRSEVFLGGG
mmetsp:Transcript_31232/g.68231  ORF Transcript_31232/g.68231 Transcript_31232/m.68231 type:complete len:454 (+) Transcript_31232:246-1607(+)